MQIERAALWAHVRAGLALEYGRRDAMLMKDARQPMFLVCVSDQAERLREPATRKPAKNESSAASSRRSKVG